MKEYLMTAQAALEQHGSSKDGLGADEAAARLEKNGENRLEDGRKKSMARRIWEQVRDPMIIVLIAAAIVSGVFGEYADMVIILVVVVLNAALGIFQESKAEKAIEALRRMSAPNSRVRRGGTVAMVETSKIVAGDVVLLEAGDAVPADMRLIETADLRIEEAALTGESVAVSKMIAELDGDEISLGDRINMAYAGTSVVYGRGEGVVTATGMDTEMGRIAGMLADTKEDKTPLQKRLAGLSRILSVSVLAICALIFIISIIRGGGFAGGHVFEAFMTSVSLAVAAIPEGLVVVVTVLLSMGVTQMSERNAIIRRLTAVETLGCTQVVCSDKTGTLTLNKMTVADAYGAGPELWTALWLCHNAEPDGEGGYIGDPTETALVEYAKKSADGGGHALPDSSGRMGEAPFDSDRKMMTVLYPADGGVMQYSKGAPDEILARCTHALVDGELRPVDDAVRERINGENRRMAGKALRVLAAAGRMHAAPPEEMDPGPLERGMTFLGLAGMIDPIRPEARDAVHKCISAGIRPVMITGDHRDTAVAIGTELGIITDASQAITGAELAAMPDEELERRITEFSVYARVQPEHKVRIVRAWQKRGSVTAMTGDGVNDAPALKTADIGVGMGVTGTDVTKNVADMVLADDNFATIIYAVEEGRRIYENVRKAVQFLLASNLSEVVSIFIATLMGFKLFSPIHILWINLVTDTFPAMALGMEKAEPDAMEKPPRDPGEGILAGGLGVSVLYQGAVIAALALISYFIGGSVSELRGMSMAFLTLSLCEVFHSLNMHSRTGSIFKGRLGNKYLFGAMALTFVLTLGVLYIPGLNTIFKLEALPLGSFLTAFGVALAIIPIVELAKLIDRCVRKRKTA